MAYVLRLESVRAHLPYLKLSRSVLLTNTGNDSSAGLHHVNSGIRSIQLVRGSSVSVLLTSNSDVLRPLHVNDLLVSANGDALVGSLLNLISRHVTSSSVGR